MKLLCISDGWFYKPEMNKPTNGPKYLEECTAVGENSFGYFLMEYPSIHSYEKCYFIPISDKDEKDYSEEILEKIFAPN